MDWEGRCIRTGAAALLCAGLLRLSASGLSVSPSELLADPRFASFFVYLQTGRVVKSLPPPTLSDSPPSIPVLPPTQAHSFADKVPLESTSQQIPAELPIFQASDLDLVEITYDCSYEPDMEELLTRPLSWDLTQASPAVLIVHTHTTESYTPLPDDDYTETSEYRTLDPAHNVLSLGDLMKHHLEEAGITVYHDTQFHDYPVYNTSYTNTAASTEEILAQHPEILLILDLHRDAADTSYGQLVTQCSIGAESAAQIMIVAGSDAGGLEHPHWEENLSLGLKLHAQLERTHPGICRPLHFTYNRYNQHLGNRALLIEIGAAGNTLPEAKRAATALSDAIIDLCHGTDEPSH